MDLAHLSSIATHAARAAGKVIQKHMNDDLTVEKKEGGTSYASQVVTEVDRASERVILSYLLPTCDTHALALLSEETEDDGSRFEKEFFWCVDPMDGTLPFLHKRAGFSVSIALVSKDGTPQIGVVFNPSTNTLYHAIIGHGAYKDERVWKLKPANNYLTYVTDRKRKDTPRAAEIELSLQGIVDKLNLHGVKELAGSGAVLNAIHVLENRPACMLKFPKNESGGGSIWDFAATACIFQELGLPATNFAGGKLDLNRKDDAFMNHEGVLFTSLL